MWRGLLRCLGWLTFPVFPIVLGALLAGLVTLPWEGEVTKEWGVYSTRAGMEGEQVTLEGGVTRTTLRFLSSQDTCEAWLYLPPGAPPDARLPVVVMGPGFGLEKSQGMEAYGQAFAAGGVAALVLEYRRWGGSSGMPRQLLDPWTQAQDYEAALNFIQTSNKLSEVLDGDRVALWGFDTSAGHALIMAARNPSDVRAVVALAPSLDSAPLYDAIFNGRGYLWAARFLAAAISDTVRGGIGMQQPMYVPLVGAAGSLAALALAQDEADAHPSKAEPPAGDDSTLGVCRDLSDKCVQYAAEGKCYSSPLFMVGESMGTVGRCRLSCNACPPEGSADAALRHPAAWRNLVPARFLLPSRAYRPASYLPGITCPVLLIAATRDAFAPARVVRAAAAALPEGVATLVEWNTTHYRTFQHGATPEGAAVMLNFLRLHLGVRAADGLPEAPAGAALDGGDGHAVGGGTPPSQQVAGQAVAAAPDAAHEEL